MPVTMHQAAIPVTIHHLQTLTGIIDKAIAHCAARKIDQSTLINFRLAPDMLPFSTQVRFSADLARGLAAGLCGVDSPAYSDTETNFDELKERIAKTIAYLKTFRPEQMEGSEQREIVLKTHGGELRFPRGDQYLLKFFIPNYYFHLTAAYLILRHCGIEIGKMDFLGSL